MSLNCMSLNDIVPTDVKIYYENGTPYMEYRGVTQNPRFDKVEIYLPKISLSISSIEYTENLYDPDELHVTFSDKYLVHPHKNVFTAKTIERNMTKAQIEKELGYKVNIVEK